MGRRLLYCLVLLSAISLSAWAFEPVTTSDGVLEALRSRLEEAETPGEITLHGEPLLAGSALSDFYLNRFFEPCWTEKSHPKQEAYAFLEFLEHVGDEGLDPHHYHFQVLEDSLQEIDRGAPDAEQLADFDLLMSDAFLVLASHLAKGCINPETIDPDWYARRRDFDPVPTLRRALASGDIQGTLEKLLPSSQEYAGLRKALHRYRKIAEQGGWHRVPKGVNLSPGDRSLRVPFLRDRLIFSGDYTPPSPPGELDLYDPQLVEAVQRFQARHGLKPDGIVGRKTLAALNVSAGARVRQIEANMERWRWLPRNLGDHFILVNIPAFRLYLVDGDKRILDMKVVVGKPYRHTPVFTARMTYLVINPYWEVPREIAVEEFIPKMQKDPKYLSRLGITVFRGWGADAREVDPSTINWKNLSEKYFPYHLRQDPGDLNPLGHIKFMFPNPYAVYLHDTPTRQLFLKENRSFSHGCIRVEKALDMASYLLKDTALGNREVLESTIREGETFSVRLPRPFPVYILYWTAWPDDEGAVQFRCDIYGRDRVLEQALSVRRPITEGQPERK
jgi:murein L,D-transpeptidase YcbB/YkuD